MSGIDWTVACHCGCGERVPFRDRKRNKRRYVLGHARRKKQPVWKVELKGYETHCWIWKGTLGEPGYALVQRAGKTLRVHRCHYEEKFGKIPTGLVLDHLCSNKDCVNPDHLEAVTQAENVRRSVSTKLDWEKVREIRKRHDEGQSAYSLAKEYGVHKTNVRAIVKEWTWQE